MRRDLVGAGIALAIGSLAYATYRSTSVAAPSAAPLVAAVIASEPASRPAPAPRSTATATPMRRLADRESATAIAAHVQRAAARHGVPASLVAAVIAVESQFNPRAISRRGAIGLMQLMPGTAAGLGVRDAFDPRQNVDAGARHLRDLLDRFANDVSLALAAYNAGAQAVIEHGGVPPYPETRAFVARVLGRIEQGMLPATLTAATPRRVRVAARFDGDGMRESPLAVIPVTFVAREDDRGSDTLVSGRATPPMVASTSAPRVESPRAEAP